MPLTPNNREEHWLQGMVDGSTDLTPNKRSEYWYKEIMESRGGGGGSSDWTTAEVTITAKGDMDTNFICFFDTDEYYEGSPAMVVDSYYFEANTPTTLKVPMYKGKCLQTMSFPPDIYEYTGGIELSMELDGLLITGDGTISPK